MIRGALVRGFVLLRVLCFFYFFGGGRGAGRHQARGQDLARRPSGIGWRDNIRTVVGSSPARPAIKVALHSQLLRLSCVIAWVPHIFNFLIFLISTSSCWPAVCGGLPANSAPPPPTTSSSFLPLPLLLNRRQSAPLVAPIFAINLWHYMMGGH